MKKLAIAQIVLGVLYMFHMLNVILFPSIFTRIVLLHWTSYYAVGLGAGLAVLVCGILQYRRAGRVNG